MLSILCNAQVLLTENRLSIIQSCRFICLLNLLFYFFPYLPALATGTRQVRGFAARLLIPTFRSLFTPRTNLKKLSKGLTVRSLLQPVSREIVQSILSDWKGPRAHAKL